MDLDLSKASEAQNEGPPISLPLFSLINQARNEHGMRQQDFHRYRTFCSTKVHRLREAMNKTHVEAAKDHQQGGKKKKEQIKKTLTKKQKMKAQSAIVQRANSKGKGHVFMRKTISVDEVENDRPAQLLLFEAERAWAYSQELKQEAFDKDQDSVIRKHGLHRIRRAVGWSKSLLELLTALGSKRVDVMSRAEVAAYHALLRGYESFDKEHHQACVEQLSVTRKLLYAIADASNDSRNEALANSYVDSTEAMLRFCGYNLGLGEQDMDALAKEQATPEVCQKVIPGLQGLIEELEAKKQAETGGKEVRKLVSVQWHSQEIAIRNPELVDVILRVEGEENKLRASLKSKGGKSGKAVVAKDRKRQRLTSAQRSAKKRGHGVSVASTTAATSSSKTLSTSSKTEMDPYDSLLAALTEAEDTARRLVQDNAEALAKSHSSRYEAASTGLTNAHEYLLYKLLSIRIERNAKLIGEVEEKGEGRQKRVQEAAERKVQALSSGPKARREGSQPVKRKVKPEKKKIRPAGAKPKKQRKPRAAATSATTRTKKASPKKKQKEDRLRKQALLKAQRISVRSVPGIAKLLDSCEMSCSGISTLGLVESEANISTLIEAKSAWYKSELLRVLAKSYAWNGEEDKSLLLLNRSELFIREARSAMELVEESEVESENQDVYPVMSEETFAKSEGLIEQFRRRVQRDMLVKRRRGALAKAQKDRSTLSQSKANVAINDMAIKYVDFDPVDLKQASQISSQREVQLFKESNGTGEEDSDDQDEWKEAEADEETDRQARERQISLATTTFSDDFDDQLVGKSNDTGGAYDPANLVEDDDEDDDEAEKAANQKGRWLGGWFGRK
jgi:signal recognition particle subunit SRP68